MKTVAKPPHVIEIGPSTSAIRLHFTSTTHPAMTTTLRQMSLPSTPMISAPTSTVQRFDPPMSSSSSVVSTKPVVGHEYIKPLQYFVQYLQPAQQQPPRMLSTITTTNNNDNLVRHGNLSLVIYLEL